MNFKRVLLSGLTALVLGFSAKEVNAATLKVSQSDNNTYSSIQSAIDTSIDGDTVLVNPGTYSENIDFKGKNIVVKSSQGPQVTTIDGRKEVNPVVRFRNHETNQAVLEGFAITGGIGNPPAPTYGSEQGGGIYMGNAEPTIRGNIIRENGLARSTHPFTVWGGGIMCRSEGDFTKVYHPIIIGNIIKNNRAYHNGGGIGLLDAVAPYICDNVITENTTTLGDGGGIWSIPFHGDGTVIRKNIITKNFAEDHGGGIYVGAKGPLLLDIDISENIIASNTANSRANVGDSGGGIWSTSTYASIRKNTIVKNIGNGGDGDYGGGISLYRWGSPTIEQNIIAYSSGGGIRCYLEASPIIRNNLVWLNTPSDGTGSCLDWADKDGNFTSDPLFCNLVYGDYSLAENSPALTNPIGTIGAISIPGCKSVPVIPVTWGTIKAMYRSRDIK